MEKNLGIAGFACGIVSLVLALISSMAPLFALLSLPVGVVGLVLSALSGKKLQAQNMPKGFAGPGLIIGIVATSIGAIAFFTCGICAASSAYSSYKLASLFF